MNKEGNKYLKNYLPEKGLTISFMCNKDQESETDEDQIEDALKSRNQTEKNFSLKRKLKKKAPLYKDYDRLENLNTAPDFSNEFISLNMFDNFEPSIKNIKNSNNNKSRKEPSDQRVSYSRALMGGRPVVLGQQVLNKEFLLNVKGRACSNAMKHFLNQSVNLDVSTGKSKDPIHVNSRTNKKHIISHYRVSKSAFGYRNKEKNSESMHIQRYPMNT